MTTGFSFGDVRGGFSVTLQRHSGSDSIYLPFASTNFSDSTASEETLASWRLLPCL